MGKGKLSINVPPAPPAAGFFSPETIKKAEEAERNVISPDASLPQQSKEKNKGGRPKSEVKKKQYTLTMDPDLYDTLKKEAKARHISFSYLITEAALEYLSQNPRPRKKAIE